MGNEGEAEMLTVQEAASRAGIGETGIRNALQRGRLPFTTMYGRKLIKASDLEKYKTDTKIGRPRKSDTDAPTSA